MRNEEVTSLQIPWKLKEKEVNAMNNSIPGKFESRGNRPIS